MSDEQNAARSQGSAALDDIAATAHRSPDVAAALGGGPIDMIETHAARVLVGRTHALKIKRPVRYDYLDFSRAELCRSGKPVELTPTEYRLLKTFVENAGRVLTRQQLIDSAWDTGTFITDRVVDTHVWSLRKKIETNPAAPHCLHGVRGIGYRFDLLTQP